MGVPHTSVNASPRAASPAGTAQPARSDHYWGRLFATGLCYLVFGLAALFLGVIWLPLVRLTNGRGRARARSRAAIAAGLRMFLAFTRRMGVLRYSLDDLGKLSSPGQVIVANHPTLIDMAFLLGFVPDANCIVKSSLFANPVTGGAVAAAGYIANSPTHQMIHDAERALCAGETLVIFPEGTRTLPNQPVELQRGAANIALRAGRGLTPVFISCEPPMLSKHMPWYRIPDRRPCFTICAGHSIDLEEFRSAPLPAASRSLNVRLTELFNQAGQVRDSAS